MTGGLRMLLVDDDERFRQRLAKALRQRGYPVFEASSYDEALRVAAEQHLDRAVIDLRMPGRNGLEVLRDLLAAKPALKAVVLTGYGSIATAIEAVRSGAVDYVTKPCDADRLLAAFEGDAAAAEPSFELPSLARVEFEYIERVLQECNGNVSKAARALGIHRRTLQYKLAKFPVSR